MIFFLFILKKIYARFLLFFGVMTAVFTIGNLFLRTLPAVSGSVFLSFILVSIPVMAIYSVPFSASFAMYTVLSDLVVHDEMISVYYLVSMTRSLKLARTIFCCTMVLLYSYLLFFLAPSAYQHSKTILVSAVEEHVRALPAGVMQQIGPTAALYCQAKQQQERLCFLNLFLALRQHGNKLLCCASQTASLNEAELVCERGHIVFTNQESSMVVNFNKATMSLEALIPHAVLGGKHSAPRIATGSELVAQWRQADMWRELYKRIAQLWWLVVITILSMKLAFYDSSKKNRFVRGILISGALFMLSHSFIAIGYACSNALIFSLSVGLGSGIVFLLLMSRVTKP